MAAGVPHQLGHFGMLALIQCGWKKAIGLEVGPDIDCNAGKWSWSLGEI